MSSYFSCEPLDLLTGKGCVSGSATAWRTRSSLSAFTTNSSFPSSVRAMAFLAMICDFPFGIAFQTMSLKLGPGGAPLVDFHGSSSFGQNTMSAVVASIARPPVITAPKVLFLSPTAKMLSPLSVSASVSPQGLLSRYRVSCGKGPFGGCDGDCTNCRGSASC